MDDRVQRTPRIFNGQRHCLPIFGRLTSGHAPSHSKQMRSHIRVCALRQQHEGAVTFCKEGH
eukprot:3405827-Amphidinium_carterae.1